MSHRLFPPTSLWSTLSLIDQQSAEQTRQLGCRHCGGRLHRARYVRKPRGVARAVLGDAYIYRESFCCASCRRRTTPVSLRFLGRKVYLGALLILFGNAAPDAAPTPMLYRALAARTGIPSRTLERWRQWWTETLPGSRWWRELRSSFVPMIRTSTLPNALLERVTAADETGRLIRVLALTRPLSTTSCSHFPRLEFGTQKMS